MQQCFMHPYLDYLLVFIHGRKKKVAQIHDLLFDEINPMWTISNFNNTICGKNFNDITSYVWACKVFAVFIILYFRDEK